MNKLKKQSFNVKLRSFLKVNDEIFAPIVRVVGKNIKVGIYNIEQALKIAYENNLDLVEISPNSDPPVCKIMDYSKFKYEQRKKKKTIKISSTKVIKEIRFGPNINDHDFRFKLKYAIKFLNDGLKLRIYIQFKGRSIVFKERGELLLLRFMKLLKIYGRLDQLPKLEGRRMILMIFPNVL